MKKSIIYIKWRDSAMYHAQEDNNYNFEVSTLESAGFLIKENKDSIVLARDVIRDESRSVLVIPKENIIRRNVLRP